MVEAEARRARPEAPRGGRGARRCHVATHRVDPDDLLAGVHELLGRLLALRLQRAPLRGQQEPAAGRAGGGAQSDWADGGFVWLGAGAGAYTIAPRPRPSATRNWQALAAGSGRGGEGQGAHFSSSARSSLRWSASRLSRCCFLWKISCLACGRPRTRTTRGVREKARGEAKAKARRGEARRR